jgi:hypothetical protein
MNHYVTLSDRLERRVPAVITYYVVNKRDSSVAALPQHDMPGKICEFDIFDP